jgi:hypothetical protein
MIRLKWLLSAALLLAVGPAAQAQFLGQRQGGWPGPGVPRGYPWGMPVVPGDPGLPFRQGGFGPSTVGDIAPPGVFGNVPGLAPAYSPYRPDLSFPPNWQGLNSPYGRGLGPAGNSAWPRAGMVPQVVNVPAGPPAPQVRPEIIQMLEAASVSLRPQTVPAFQPPPAPPPVARPPLAAAPQQPPRELRGGYALVVAGAALAAALLYALLRRKPAA